MKQNVLIAFLLAAPLAAMAQFTIFTDDFTHGSTLNQTSNPGGTPFASFTSYDIAASKAAFTGPTLTNGEFKTQLNAATSSGLIEAQALFTKNPITLVNIGDSITLTYTFRMTNAFAGTTAYLGQGLYNSGGQPPVPGGLNNSGLGTGTAFGTGNAQLWQGIDTRIFSAGTSIAITRPPQNGGGVTAANQALISPSGVTGGYSNPNGATLDGSTNGGTLTLNNGSYYTISYTIVLADTNTPTLTLTNTLSDSSSNVLFVMTNAATGAAFQTAFDGLAFGRRETGTPLLVTMVITNITITANLSSLPGQPFNVLGGGQGCPGGTFPVGLNGSVTSNDYYLYTNGVWNGVVQTGTGAALNFPVETVISVPLTNTVFASNTVSGATGFMLGSVVVSPNPPPAITTQPIPVIVAGGNIGVFNVVATGGGLTYQWYKNGFPLSNLGHYSGVTTATLVISPADGSDAANTAQGYYAIITGGCGATLPTATNSLTISAPANITWQGGNPDTNWDLSTPNFTNGAAFVAFHNGDNVTFDDTSIVPTVNVANNFLAPTLITESAGQSYVFAGPGVIQGSGALVMNGPGILSINNSNAFTGGVTINGGSLILSNQFGAGLGTITMAGGTLDVPNAFNSAAGISNNINATGSTTLQFDKTGTFACVWDGAIMGSPSGTLTVFNNSAATATSRLRMYGAFTNSANVVLTSSGSEIEFAPYLSSGNQIFNGVISGNFGHIVPRGTGNVVLNNTNVFNDKFGTFSGINGYSVFLSSGNVGIGADSVSSTPGIIDASPVGTGILGINVGAEGGTCSIFSYGGAHTIANILGYTSATNTVTVVFGGTNNLTFSGEFDLANTNTALSGITGPTDTSGTNRMLQVTNTAATTFTGLVTDNGNSSGIIKTGNGALYLNGVNAYTGPTTVSGGILAGSSTIISPVVVQTNGAIGGGPAASIGTLTINNTLNFDSGNTFIRVNKSLFPGQSNDVVSVSGALANSGTGNGTVTVTNIGATAVVVGDTFKIFNKAVTGGATLNVTGAGMTWTNRLATDGTITALSIAPTTATNPTNILFSLSGTNLSLSWPADHKGWYLQMNTNALNSNSWVDVAGSNGGTNSVLPIVPGQPKAFFRMSLQP